MSKRIVTFAEIILHLAPNGYCRFFQDDQPQATFGGGDSFGGGLIYALLNGKDSQSAIEFAVAASALLIAVDLLLQGSRQRLRQEHRRTALLRSLTEQMAGLGAVLHGVDLQPQSPEAQHTVPVTDDGDLSHKYHAAFPGWRRRTVPPGVPS